MDRARNDPELTGTRSSNALVSSFRFVKIHFFSLTMNVFWMLQYFWLLWLAFRFVKFSISRIVYGASGCLIHVFWSLWERIALQPSLVGPTVFRGPLNFEPTRGIWVFATELSRGIYRGIRIAAEFRGIWRFSFEQLFFHRKWPQSSSVTSFFMMIFCLMVMVEWWKWWLMNE